MSTMAARRCVATPGLAKSRLKIRPKVWRLETLKKVNAEIEAWMSIGSRPGRNTPLATPLWIPQGLWVAGLVWMCVVLALMLIRASVAMVTGDIAAVKALCGVISAREEAEEGAKEGERIIQGERA